MTKEELKERFQEIIDRTSGDVERDIGDAIQALFDYVDDSEIEAMYERITW